MLMTLEQIKQYLKITDTSLDADITLFEPVEEAKINYYIDDTIEALGIEFYPDYARLVLLLASEGTTSLKGGPVKSWSFDGESVSYGDNNKTTGVSVTSDEQLSKFNPLRKVWR